MTLAGGKTSGVGALESRVRAKQWAATSAALSRADTQQLWLLWPG